MQDIAEIAKRVGLDLNTAQATGTIPSDADLSVKAESGSYHHTLKVTVTLPDAGSRTTEARAIEGTVRSILDAHNYDTTRPVDLQHSRFFGDIKVQGA